MGKGKRGYLPKQIWLAISVVLFAFSFLLTGYLSFKLKPSQVARTLEKAIAQKENLFYSLLKDSSRLASITVDVDKSTHSSNMKMEEMPIGVFVYRINDVGHPLLTSWNSSFLDPEMNLLEKSDGAYPVNNNKGFFEQIIKTIQFRSGTYKVVGFVPIYWQYLQASSLFNNHFDGYPNLDKSYMISNQGTEVKNGEGKVLFHLTPKSSNHSLQIDTISLILKLIAIGIWCLLLNDFIRRFAFQKGFFAGLGLFLLIILTARLLSYYFPFPFNFRTYELFDPLIYASSWVHRSLGDLVINLFLLLWITSYVKKNFWLLQDTPIIKKLSKYKLIFAILGLASLTFITILFVRMIETLVSDSQVSFNVTKFFSMNVYTVICIVALAFFMWCYIRISYLLIWPSRYTDFSALKKAIIILASGLLFTTLFSNVNHILSDCVTVLWVVCYTIILDYCWERLKSNFIRSPDFLMLVVFFSASFTSIIYTKYRQLELKDRKFFAENLGMRSDETGEALIRIGINNMNTYFLQNGTQDLYVENKNQSLKYRIENENFSGYLNRYSINIYTFDSLKHPLFNTDSVRYETLQNNIQMLARKTDMPDLYYNSTSPEQFSYIYRKKVASPMDTTNSIYLFILVKPLRYSDNQLDVRLFNTAKSLPGDLDNDYSYAIYYNKKLISRHLNNNYSSVLDESMIPKGEYNVINSLYKSTLTYNAGDSKIIIVTQKMNVWLDIVTLFAYIFCSAIVVLALSYFLIHLLFSGFNIRYFQRIMRLTINRQIQATIIFLSLFSFLVVSISTISFSLAQFRESSKIRLSKSAKIVQDETQNSIKNDLFLANVNEIDDENFSNDAFVRKVLQIAALNDLDINYYNLNGTLEATTQPTIYGNGFFNALINPVAFFMLKNREQLEYTQEERIGSFKFSSIYFPLQDTEGNDIAYLNIPYLNSQNEARLQISQFLVTVIDLNALIFIFAGFLGLRFTQRITSTFKILADKMQVINLTGKNEPLIYKKHDEIGALVRGYNQMLKQLSESAEALAVSERQGAWQEMARQIAHEIKNPLTPMKLSIQYLDRSIASGAENTEELSKKVTQTLIEQIDQLSQIASDFSQFANINNVAPVVLDLRDSLSNLINLYQTDGTLDISFMMPNSPVLVLADKNQINRLFTNLIKNAIEASINNDEKYISIRFKTSDKNVEIAIEDKGVGISDEMRNKIFVPNFTTKSSGTGLGLAICKGICERAGGTIYFESSLGKGTTFFVTLPLIESNS